MDSSVKLLWVPRTILAALLCIMLTASVVRAANLTTFEDYETMSSNQRFDIQVYVLTKVYKRALERGNHERALCLRKTFLLTEGSKKEVALAHVHLRGRITNAIENPHPEGRVEYLVAHHAMEVCPLKNVAEK